MARINPLWKVLSLCALASAGFASAQQPATTKPSQQPPQLERIEPGSDVPVTTVPEGQRVTITERRQNGEVVEADVQSGRSHYNMKPNKLPGNAQVGDATGQSIRAPTWTLLQFGNAKKKETTEPVATGPADAPPPPNSK